MALNSLNDLFIMELKDMLSAEHQIVQALPKMIDAASSQQLKDKFQQHLDQTREQAQRLEKIFSMLGVPVEEEFCVGMAGIIKEGEKLIEEQGEPMVMDAGLIGAAQKVEHYEISAYGTLRTFARTLGRDDVADMLQTTLKEESYTDQMLTKVAEQSINKKAA
ncbi:MAG: YciE/YciF ferroxidase family protein [Armatimonadota bacterium]